MVGSGGGSSGSSGGSSDGSGGSSGGSSDNYSIHACSVCTYRSWVARLLIRSQSCSCSRILPQPVITSKEKKYIIERWLHTFAYLRLGNTYKHTYIHTYIHTFVMTMHVIV